MLKEIDTNFISVGGGGIYVTALSKNFFIDSVMKQIIDKRGNKRFPYDVDTKILIYEDRQKTWFFEIADCLKLMNEAGFIILMIAISYLEANQQFRDGKSSYKNSMKTIERAIKRIFPNLENKWIKPVIDGSRNGLFHSGMTKQGVLISASMDKVFSDLKGSLVINPHLFLDTIKKDCEEYITKLKDKKNKELRKNFEKFWDSSGGFNLK